MKKYFKYRPKINLIDGKIQSVAQGTVRQKTIKKDFRIPVENYNKIIKEAKEDGSDFSKTLNRIISEHFEEKEIVNNWIDIEHFTKEA